MEVFGGILAVKAVVFLTFSIFAIAAVGYSIGRIEVKGIDLGTAGVFIVALVYGCLLYTKLSDNLMAGEVTFATDALKIVSMIVIGALAAGNIKVNTIVAGTFGGSEVVLQNVLDSICPKLLPLGVLALVIYLLKKKRKSSVFILITLFVIGFALTFLNFLG